MKLHLLEILPITLYFFGILALGFFRRSKSNEVDFILGGRQLTLPAFIATLVTTWYGGILGVGEFTFLYGISNWIVFGLPYYIFAILYAQFLAARVRKHSFLSIPDLFYHHYGKTGGMLSAVFTFFMTLPAPYILMIGFLLHFVSGWPLWLCITGGALFSMLYVTTGGFRAVVRTDKLQFLLMFGGFIMLLAVLIVEYGGLDFLRSNLPENHLSWHGGNSWQYITVWFFIALWTFVDPGFHQRCQAARSGKIAKRGILLSVVFWFFFDLMTTFAGLYARALLPADSTAAVLSFPLLSHEFLPPLLSGIFLTGLFAIIMSTVDSFTLLSAMTIGRDIYPPDQRGKGGQVATIRFGLFITAAISIVLAIFIPSVIELWLLIGNIFIPPMLLPLLACYFPRLQRSPKWMVINMSAAFLTAFIFLLLAALTSPSLAELSFYAEIPPMYPGLFISGIIFAFSPRKNQNQ